jgi:hypothetical protein
VLQRLVVARAINRTGCYPPLPLGAALRCERELYPTFDDPAMIATMISMSNMRYAAQCEATAVADNLRFGGFTPLGHGLYAIYITLRRHFDSCRLP